MEGILYTGRPADCSGRLDKEIRSYDLLDGLGVVYQRTDHQPTDSMENCRAVDAVLGVTIYKNLFLCNRQKTAFYLLAMPGDKPFKTKELSGQLGIARLSFAGAEEMARYLDVTPGSVSVLGLANDRERAVRLLLDEDLQRDEWFACHPCINTSSVRFKTADLLEKILPATGHAPTWVRLGAGESAE